MKTDEELITMILGYLEPEDMATLLVEVMSPTRRQQLIEEIESAPE